jgi:hypothetical protein
MIEAGLLGRRIGILVGFAKTVAAQQEDLRVFDEAVGDGSSNGGIEQNVAPVGERSVGSDDGGAFVTVTSRYDLVKEIGGLLIERQIT